MEVKPNPRFDRGHEEIEEAVEEYLPLGTIHMIGGQNHPDLANRIQGETIILLTSMI